MVSKSRSTSGVRTGSPKKGKNVPHGTGKKAAPGGKASSEKQARAKTKRKTAGAGTPTRRPSPARKKTAPKKREAPARASKAAGTSLRSGASAEARAHARKPAARSRAESAPLPSSSPALGSGGEYDLMRLRNAPLPYEIVEGEAYMGPQQKEHFRRLLEAWRRELMEEVDRTVRYMQDEAANFPDANDRATQEAEFSLELRTRDRERKLIRKIDEALTRIETDEYGYCVTCGEQIGIRRLEARPIATQCIDCKERDEKRERQNRGL